MFSIIFSTLSSVAFSHQVPKQRILELLGKKTSVYNNSGIFFHKSDIEGDVKVEKIRSFYSSKRGFERVVVEFNTKKLPGIYGHIHEGGNKVYLDALGTKPNSGINQNVTGKYLKSIDIFALDKSNTTLELNFSGNYNFNIFYLNSPGRLVIDVRK